MGARAGPIIFTRKFFLAEAGREKVFIYQRDKCFIIEKIPGWIERLLLLKLNEITGEIKTIHTRIDSVEKDVAGLRREMMTKFESVDAKVESLRTEAISRFEAVDRRFDSLEARLPVIEKMAELEVRLADCVAF